MRVVEAEAVANCLVSRFSSIRHNHYCTPVVGIADEVNAATSASGPSPTNHDVRFCAVAEFTTGHRKYEYTA